MHEAVLDGHFQHGDQVWMPFGRPVQSSLDGSIQFLAEPAVITVHFVARRPIHGRVRWQAAAYRVNSKSKELVEYPVKGAQSKSAISEQIPVKGLDMPDIENDPVSLRNRPVIQGFFPDDAKEFIGSAAGIEKACVKVVPDADS